MVNEWCVTKTQEEPHPALYLGDSEEEARKVYAENKDVGLFRWNRRKCEYVPVEPKK